MIHSLADVVQESGASRDRAVEPELVGNHLREERNLNRVAQHILAVTRTEVHLAECLDDLWMKPPNVGFDDGVVTDLHDLLFDIALGLLDEFLDTRRVNASVGNKSLQCFGCDRLAHAVKA